MEDGGCGNGIQRLIPRFGGKGIRQLHIPREPDGADGTGAAQLDRQPAVDLGMAGEQGGSGRRLPQQFGGGLRVVGARGDAAPGFAKVDGDAAHAGSGKQEAQLRVGDHVHVDTVEEPGCG